MKLKPLVYVPAGRRRWLRPWRRGVFAARIIAETPSYSGGVFSVQIQSEAFAKFWTIRGAKRAMRVDR